MKLTYFGTAAYEGVPALFCDCAVCQRSVALGGRNIRTRSQALLNDDLLLDFPPDTFLHYLQHRDAFRAVEYCLITHSHSDHFDPDDIEALRPGYSHDWRRPWHFFSGKAAATVLADRKSDGAFDATELQPFVETTVGRYAVLPLPAAHSPDTAPLIYRIGDGEKTILYAHDTGRFPEETFAALAAAGKLDLLSLDGTLGFQHREKPSGHLSFEESFVLIDDLCKAGVVTDETKIVLNHFSHHAGATYDEMVEKLPPFVTIAYDGMTVEI